MDEIFRDAFQASAVTQITAGAKLAENILFPPQEDSDSSGEEEDSDWIVSDGEAEYLDLREMFENASSSDRVIICHPEGESVESFSEDKDCDFLPLPLIDAVCKEGSVEAIKKVLEVNCDAYTLEATDDKGL